MRKCEHKRCQICKFVEEGNTFKSKDRTYWINFVFNCNSQGMVYSFIRKQCAKLYVRSTITSFRKRFNNHKSS